MRNRKLRLCIQLASATVLTTLTIHKSLAAVTWTGAAGTNWATNGNWSNNASPGTTDTVIFGDTGSSNLPGELTSLVNIARTIGGLSFNNSASHFHTLDLNTQTLTITGNLNFNIDQAQTSLTTIRDGTLAVSGAFANFNVGRGVSGSSVGVADFSGLSAFNANVASMLVGASAAGSAKGTLTLAPLNTIGAQLIQIGASNSSNDTNGTLNLGLSNSILAAELDIGKDNSTGQINIVNNGSLSLGSAAQPTLLQIANQNTITNNTYSGVMNLGNATVNLQLSSLIIAEKNGGPGGTVGQLIGTGAGTITIGSAASPGNIYVGYTVNGGGTQGTVDLRHLNSMQAYLTDFLIGNGASGSATASVFLPINSTINASNSVTVAADGGGNSTLNLGQNTTILANAFIIGKDDANGTVVAPSGGILTIGSAAQPTALSLAVSNATTNNSYSGQLNLTGATLNGYLSQLIVGQRISGGGAGSAVGIITGATGGSITIGGSGNTANFIVGNAISDNASGIVDFSGLSNLSANLNTLSIGVSQSGSSQGTVKLAANNTISANSIIVGSSGDGSNLLALGNSNTILANQFTVAQDYSNGRVTIPNGGTLNLGSPSQRTNLTIASGTTNTLNTYTGYFDMTGATLVAYLDNVVIGNKNPPPGGEYGVFTISTRTGNYVNANSILIGGAYSTGILNFGGGQLFAGSISTASTGTSSFNWTGGQLSVGTFGTPTVSFNLNNSGTGTLAPGSAISAIGTTTVYGNYSQSTAAALTIQIAGNSPGSGNDQLNISGSASLAGTLNLSLINGFMPSAGQNYILATYASHAGSFAFVAPPTLTQNVAFQLDYTSNASQLLLHMVTPSPQNWTSTATVGTFSAAGNWNTNTTPGTTNSTSITNSGSLAQSVTVAASTTVHSIALQGGTAPLDLQVPQGIALGVSYQISVGTNATLSGAGQILGNVVLAGGAIAPGPQVNTLQVLGDLTAQNNSTFAIGLAGTVAQQYDVIDITGNAALGGTLHVTSQNGFVPLPGESFNVLNFGSHSGDVAVVNETGFAGLTFNKTYSASALTLIASGLNGDANLDGAVNTVDFNLLAMHFNAGGENWLQGDFNGDGQVNALDFNALATNYGQTILSPALGAIVPEPASVLTLVLIACASRRRRVPRKCIPNAGMKPHHVRRA